MKSEEDSDRMLKGTSSRVTKEVFVSKNDKINNKWVIAAIYSAEQFLPCLFLSELLCYEHVETWNTFCSYEIFISACAVFWSLCFNAFIVSTNTQKLYFINRKQIIALMQPE